MDVSDKVRENRLRRMAERQGLRLERSRRRDPWADGFATYQLVDVATSTVVGSGAEGGFGLTLDQVEAHVDVPDYAFRRFSGARSWMDAHYPDWAMAARALADLGAGLDDEEYVGGVLWVGATQNGDPDVQRRVITDRLVKWATRAGATAWLSRFGTTKQLVLAIDGALQEFPPPSQSAVYIAGDGSLERFVATADERTGTVWVPKHLAATQPALAWILKLRPGEFTRNGLAYFLVPRWEWAARMARDGRPKGSGLGAADGAGA
jgi:hypothetical protein